MTNNESASSEWTSELDSNYERLLSIGEECVTCEELKKLVKLSAERNSNFILYDGFEPSGRMHIAQGIFKSMNVNKATRSGGKFVFWVADWFALMNDKMGGDLEKIKIVGEYLIEVWSAAGMKGLHSDVVFLWASDEITSEKNSKLYWPLMLDIGRRFTITRIKKCCQIMGRLEGNLTAAQILYPLMQCTDVFFLKSDICQLGVDQRKVNMLAREYADAAKIRKPVILSHHMISGLKKGQEKMSKSDPDSAIFMEDTREDVERKILSAYCPDTQEDGLVNPCLDYIKHIIFCVENATFTVGDTTYNNFESVKEAYENKDLKEKDLKQGLIYELNALLEPIRTHFETNEKAKQLFSQVRQFKRSITQLAKSFKKLDLVELQVVPPQSHVIFLPLPTVKPTLQMIFDTFTQIKSCSEDDVPVVLFLSDWSARVCGVLDANEKVINSFYSVYIAALTALGCGTFTVIRQSEGILKDPSNYWINVINVGRFLTLDQVMANTLKDSDCVGYVISRLMRIADVISLSPSLFTLRSTDCNSDVEISLLEKFFSHYTELTLPTLKKVSIPSLLLLQRESEAHQMDTDQYFLLDDPKVHGKSKMKKAFCQPGNTSFCPPITLLVSFSTTKQITIVRSEQNGGDVTYESIEDIAQDFRDEKLHPGDLKNAAAKTMVETLTKISQGMKSDAEATKAIKVLKAAQKKLGKKNSNK